MKKYIWIGGILIIVYLVAQYFKPEPTNWTPSYLSADKIPFGTYILHQQIHDVFPNAKVKVVDQQFGKNIDEPKKGRTNYLMFGNWININPADYQKMVKFMEDGNHVFIATGDVKGVLADALKLKTSFEPQKSPINFVNPNLKREYDYYFDKYMGSHYFLKFDTAKASVIGETTNSRANFIKIKYGNGALFLMPNPLLLTNYSLLKEDGREYAAKVLSCLPKAEYIIWDEHFARPATQDKMILRVFFDYEELRWAYYIALCSLVIFVIFEMKRRQRIIPVIERAKNTAVEFVSVVGKVYYQQRNNRDIAEKKVVYLLDYIRSKYRLRTTELDQEFKETLIRVSGANEEIITDLIASIHYLRGGGGVGDAQLIHLNAIIEKFYQQDQ